MKNETFIQYDYEELEVKKHFKWIYADYYPCFGWVLNETMPSERGRSFVHMSFKRNHEYTNRQEVIRLQKQFCSCMQEIRNLEISKIFGAVMASLMIGILGTLFLMVSVFYIHRGIYAAGFLVIPAVAAWLLAFPCYRMIRSRKEKNLELMTEQKYAELYETCRKASRLLCDTE